MNFQELLRLKGVTQENKKGAHVFMQGEADKSLYFVQSGLLKLITPLKMAKNQ